MTGQPSEDLSRTLVADEIARVRRERWSGVLALRQGEVSKGLYCLDGEIAFAASTVEEDRLGALLFRAGKISESQFREAMRASEGGRPLGQALVDAGILSATGPAGGGARAGRADRAVGAALDDGRAAARDDGPAHPGRARRRPRHAAAPPPRHAPLPGRRAAGARDRAAGAPAAARQPRGLRLRRGAALAGRARGPGAVPPADCRRRPASRCLTRAATSRGPRPRSSPAASCRRLPSRRPPGAGLDPEAFARGLLEKGDRARALEVLRAAIERDPQARRRGGCSR